MDLGKVRALKFGPNVPGNAPPKSCVAKGSIGWGPAPCNSEKRILQVSQSVTQLDS